jgi:hypothetical protein
MTFLDIFTVTKKDVFGATKDPCIIGLARPTHIRDHFLPPKANFDFLFSRIFQQANRLPFVFGLKRFLLVVFKSCQFGGRFIDTLEIAILT